MSGRITALCSQSDSNGAEDTSNERHGNRSTREKGDSTASEGDNSAAGRRRVWDGVVTRTSRSSNWVDRSRNLRLGSRGGPGGRNH